MKGEEGRYWRIECELHGVVVIVVAEYELAGGEDKERSCLRARICPPEVASCYLQTSLSSAEGLATGSVMNKGGAADQSF